MDSPRLGEWVGRSLREDLGILLVRFNKVAWAYRP